MKGQVFDIQNYAIHDGPGVRTCVFLKGCPLRCAWCHNPESQRRGPQLVFDEQRCAGCGRCLPVCPEGARSRSGDAILLARERCTACGACAEACLEGASQRVGRTMDVAEVLAQVLPDRPFFASSGGGVTFSGGEPTLQSEFLLALLDGFREAGVHTAVETCGLFPPDLVDPLCARVDLFLFDLKHMSEERHRLATGRGNRVILQNLARILERVGPERLVPRLPIIPEFNAEPESVAAVAEHLLALGYRGPVQLLPYHPWAAQKYERLSRRCDRRPDLDESGRDALTETLLAFGLAAEWN